MKQSRLKVYTTDDKIPKYSPVICNSKDIGIQSYIFI